MTFYQILTLASIVEREAMLDQEKPLIAGVYANRLDPRKWPLGLLQSDPTIFYRPRLAPAGQGAVDKWTTYTFWAPIKGGLTDETLPADLAGYNTYTSKGLPPGPIDTPTLTSIDAALEPDTKDGYLYFVAKGDGSGTTAFAKTLKEHQANVKKYVEAHAALSPQAGARAWPVAGGLRATRRRRRSRPMGRGRPGRATGPPGAPSGPVRGGRRRCLLRRATRAHALPHRLHPRRWRGEGGGHLRPVRRRR